MAVVVIILALATLVLGVGYVASAAATIEATKAATAAARAAQISAGAVLADTVIDGALVTLTVICVLACGWLYIQYRRELARPKNPPYPPLRRGAKEISPYPPLERGGEAAQLGSGQGDAMEQMTRLMMLEMLARMQERQQGRLEERSRYE